VYLPEHKPFEVEAWLSQLGQPSADRDYKPGHQRMRELLQPLSIKRPKLRIRIAGTNGKGSTAFMLSHALQACGMRVGLYTSPHIRHFGERIRINGTPVSETTLNTLMQTLMPIALKAGASYFEAATALALKYFSDNRVDVEILEAGVGARLDATTAIEADMALITPIGLDHQNWLGDTLADIAAEKAHISDGCLWCISALQDDEVTSILTEYNPDTQFVDQHATIATTACGQHQQENGALAFAAIRRLAASNMLDGQRLDDAKLAIGQTAIPGRLQRMQVGEATIWLDAAHNTHAVKALLPTLPTLAEPLSSILVFTREDRDLSDSLHLLRPFTRRLAGESSNGLDACYTSVADALKEELALCPDGNFLVLGSFTSVAAALDWLERNY
jgi:dihydrofolate synthase/folylpolyglutamate synthase